MTEQHFQTHDPVDVYVEIGKGSVAVHAADTTESRVRLEGPGAEEVDVRLEDGTLSVVQPNRAGFLRDRTVHAVVVVPRGSRPAVRTGSADISLHGAVGDAEVRSGSGDVTADELAGRALVETGSGSVVVGTAGEALRVKSGSGDVEVRNAEAEVSVSTGSGDVRLDRCRGPVAVKTGSGDLYVGESGADLALSTGSGDLQVRRASPGTNSGATEAKFRASVKTPRARRPSVDACVHISGSDTSSASPAVCSSLRSCSRERLTDRRQQRLRPRRHRSRFSSTTSG